eukprot:9312190-Alexandrium_andersonii.AAC.1
MEVDRRWSRIVSAPWGAWALDTRRLGCLGALGGTLKPSAGPGRLARAGGRCSTTEGGGSRPAGAGWPEPLAVGAGRLAPAWTSACARGREARAGG